MAQYDINGYIFNTSGNNVLNQQPLLNAGTNSLLTNPMASPVQNVATNAVTPAEMAMQPATQAAPTIPSGFNLAKGNYTFDVGRVGRYDGKYVFKDPVLNQYLSTPNQSAAYLRAFGIDGKALSIAPRGGYTGASSIAGIPLNQYKTGQDLVNALSPKSTFMAGSSPKYDVNTANQIVNLGSQYENASKAFGSIYDKLLGGTFKGENLQTALNYLVDYSKQANTALNQYNKLADKFLPKQNYAGMAFESNPAMRVNQRFTLPKETWKMNQQQLLNWINSHERKAGGDWFGGNLAWSVGPSLITGAALGGLGLNPTLTKGINLGAGSLLSPNES